MSIQRTRIGVRADDLGLDPRDALTTARRIGFETVELGAVSGPVAPQNLSRTGRRDLIHHVGSLGLDLGALGAAPRGTGFADPRQGEAALDQTLQILELAAEIRAPVVTTVIMSDPDPGRQGRVREALTAMANRADATGVTLAVSPRGADPEWLMKLIADLKCPNVRACLDSGEWLLRGVDPAEVAGRWAGHVAWTHVRDAVPGSRDRPGYEVAAGAGALDSRQLLAGLEGAAYGGPIVLTRETGESRSADLAKGLEQWRRLMS